MSMPRGCLKLVWGCVERGGKEVWAHIGYAWEAEDGAVHAQLRAFPMSGRIAIKAGSEEAVEAALATAEGAR